MTTLYSIALFLLGMAVSALLLVNAMYDAKDEAEVAKAEAADLRAVLRGAVIKAKGERSRRLDREIELEDLREVAAFQRDELVRIKHPAVLKEYAED